MTGLDKRREHNKMYKSMQEGAESPKAKNDSDRIIKKEESGSRQKYDQCGNNP